MFHCLFKISFLMVQLIHDKNHRLMKFSGMSADNFSTHFHSPYSINHHNSSICHIQRRDNTSDKIISSRSINKIQFLSFPFRIQYCRKNRRTIFLLHRTVIRSRVFCIHSTSARNDPALIHHRFGQSGLSRPGTTHKCDILNFIRIVDFHSIRF